MSMEFPIGTRFRVSPRVDLPDHGGRNVHSVEVRSGRLGVVTHLCPSADDCRIVRLDPSPPGLSVHINLYHMDPEAPGLLDVLRAKGV